MASIDEMIRLNNYQAGPGRFTNQGGGGGIVDLLAGIMQKKKIDDEAKMKKQKASADMYKTLRDSGYEPKKAYEAVMAGTLPDAPGGVTTNEQKATATVSKLQAQTDREKATTENISKKTSMLGTSAANLRERITNKVANNETLTTGEQKVYDEVIKKYGAKSDIETVIKNKVNKIDQTNKGDYVPMVNPAGQNKLVPKANVSKAQAKGWKTR